MRDPNERIINPRELVFGGAFVVAVIAIIAVVLATNGLSSDAGSSALPTPSPTLSPSPSTAASRSGSAAPGTPAAGGSGVPFSPANAAEERLVELARDSVDLLPACQWPSLYDDFVTAFQDRCSAEEFAQAGEVSATRLGGDLELINFVRLQDLTIADDTARGTIVGELRGKSEYTIQAAFAIENGVWKLAPAPGTSGCSAFNRVSG